MVRAALLIGGLLALSGSAAGIGQRSDAVQNAGQDAGQLDGPTERAPCDFQADAPLFLAALQAFREGDLEELPRLNESAARLDQLCGRPDPARIAAFYASLTQDQRARGLQLEHELDALRSAAAEFSASETRETDELRERLAAFLRSTEGLADLPVRAHALSLDARLAVRPLEQGEWQEAAALKIAAVEAAAQESIALFERAGQSTPTLDPRWTLARCALLRSDWDQAELHFGELEELAFRVGRSSWRERGLLGLIGIARERGSLFVVDGLLEDLATFRTPSRSWALAREVAVQLIQRDQPADALGWLEDFPPSDQDEELSANGRLVRALDQWRSLTSAAELRGGSSQRAQERLDRGSSSAQSEMAVMTQAMIHLESGVPSLALKLVRALPSTGADAGSLKDRWTLEGRALLALGRAAEAVKPLERALDLARTTDPTGGVRANSTSVQSGSRMGEWLGLSAVESLGRAYVELGEPLRAAVLFEWTHAEALTRAQCEAAIRRLSANSSCGYITWMVGADQTLAIHVSPSGEAEALAVNVKRRGMERGVQRLRDALQHATKGSDGEDWQPLAQELCASLLPRSARRSLTLSTQETTDAGATLVLSPHGALERLPFEALMLERGAPPIGVQTGLTILNSLRQESNVAPPIKGRAADWLALGAPATDRFDALPGAARELVSIGRIQPRWTAQTGAEMTRRALEIALQSGQPLHLATHVAPLADLPPGESAPKGIAPVGFVVAGDDIVSTEEVLALAPRAPLAILTACGSAEGVSVDGLSVRGMAQSMLACGTRSAIVTLWPIEDRAGERASVRIHAALLAGASPSEATRRAREFLWLLGEAPSEWAAYRLIE